MNNEQLLQRVDGLIDTVEELEDSVAVDDKPGVRWFLADLKMKMRWLEADIEKELEEERQ